RCPQVNKRKILGQRHDCFPTLLAGSCPRVGVFRPPLEQERDFILIAKYPVRTLLEGARERPIGGDQRELPAVAGGQFLPVVTRGPNWNNWNILLHLLRP